MLDVLEHIPDDHGAMRKVHELLVPSGQLVLTVPALASLWSLHDVVNDHQRRYAKTNLADVVTSAGFEIDRLEYFFLWTVPPMYLRRLLNPGDSRAVGSAEEYCPRVPGRIVGSLLYGLCVAEQAMLSRIPAPVGSSLVLIAHRGS
jgi:hypothetical protein